MVDSIRRTQSSPSSQSSQPSPESLRAAFKNLSSGVKVDGPPNTQGGTGTQPEDEKSQSDKVSGILHSLHDAVSFSTLALKSLERIGDTVKTDQDKPAPGDKPPVNVVKEFAQDLEKVKGHISDVLKLLRKRTDTAEIIQENFASADARLRDVTLAQSEAAKTGSQIQSHIPQAIDAHRGLVPERVAQLLAD